MILTATRRGLLFVAVATLALSGCGFRPLYGTSHGGGPGLDLAAIDVGLLPDRSGQLLREALQQRLDHGEGVAKRYILEVSFSVVGDSISIQRDSTATRVREVATASWSLKALDPAQTVVTSGTARALDGVNIIDQQYFAADLEGETATLRLTETIANQIVQQIASFFVRRVQTS